MILVTARGGWVPVLLLIPCLMLAVGCGRPSQESQVAQLTKAPLAPLEKSQADLPLEPQVEPAPMQALAGPTPPQTRPAEFTFLVYGDTRSFPEVHRECVAQLLRHTDASFVCHTGDMVGDGSKWSQWEQFLEITAPLRQRMPYCAAIGNHDLPRENAVRAMRQMPGIPPDVNESATYYGFDAGFLRIAMLDSESMIKGDDRQYEWARAFFAQAPDRFKIIMLHRPLWSPGPNGSCGIIREKLLPIIRETGVRLMFTAHDHMYYRTYREGLTQVITAGGGAPLYDVESPQVIIEGDVLNKTHHYCRVDVRLDAVTVTALDYEGRVIDQFHLAR